MPVYKDDNNGTFYVQCYYRDARGSKRHKTKRGFSSEVEAAVWESQFKSLNGGAMDMTFSEFVEVYASEVKPRIREHTWITKEYIINDKLVPFFGDMRGRSTLLGGRTSLLNTGTPTGSPGRRRTCAR